MANNQRIVYVPSSPNDENPYAVVEESPYEEVGSPYEQKVRSKQNAYSTLGSVGRISRKGDPKTYPEPIYGNNEAINFNQFSKSPLQAAPLPGNRIPAVPPPTYRTQVRELPNGDLAMGGSSTRRRKRSKRTLNKRKQKKRANRKTKRKSSTY